MNPRVLPLTPSDRRERTLRQLADRGLRVADALAAKIEACRTTAEILRLAEAFSQLSEEVCGALALEAELRRERESREARAEPSRMEGAEGPRLSGMKPKLH